MKKMFASIIFLWISLYSMAQNYTLNGATTKIGNNVFQLTSGVVVHDPGVAGTVWCQNKINLRFDFTVKARIFLGYNDDGADGMAFVLQPVSDTKIGGTGNGMGYNGINPSLVVEFDTYYNPPYGDPEEDHLAIMKNGNIDHNSPDNLAGPYLLPINIEDGLWHDATFSWNASTLTLTVSFLSRTYTYKGDIVNTIFHGDPSVFWGFTGGTYDAANVQAVEIVSFIGCNYINFTTTHTNATCNQPNGSITVSASGGSGSYQYSIDNGVTFINPNVFSALGDGTYKIVVKDKLGALCKSDVQSVTITQTGPYLKLTATPTPAICNMPNGSITVIASGGSGSYEYSKDKGATFQDSKDFISLAEGTYQIVVRDKAGLRCSSDVQPVTVTQTGSTIDNSITTSDSTVCQGASVKLQAVQNTQYKYQWIKDDNTIIPGATAQTYMAAASGRYKAQLVNTATGCTAVTRNVTVHIIGKPHADFTTTAPYCAGTNVNFTNTSQPPDINTVLSYSWKFGDGGISPTGAHTYKAPGTYAVTLVATVATRGCTTSTDSIHKSITVSAVDSGVTYNDVIVPPGKSYALAARPNIGYKYLWSPSAFLNDPTSRTPTVNTTADQIYLVTITAGSGCTTVDKQTVLVAKQLTGNKDSVVVIVPTAFTPNGNGRNDRLKPIPYNIGTLIYFKVYNRWGQLVFETNTLGEGWDGTQNGKPQPTETYTWILACTTGTKTIKQSGRSLLIR